MKHKERVKGFHGITRGRLFYLWISALMLLLLFPTNGSAVSWEVVHVREGLGYRNVATGDFNNDGLQDVIAVGANGADIWLQGLYFPCPAAVWSDGCYYIGNIPGDFKDVAVADFNNDGNLDFVAVGESGDDVIMLGDGDPDGDLSIGWTDGTGVFSGNYKSVKTFDHRNDGDIDIIAAGSDGFFLWQNTNPAVPTFNPISIAAVFNYNEIALVDFNNDALTDVVAARETLGISVWFGSGTSFTSKTGPVATGKYLSVAAADLDLDGKADIVAGSDNGISVWYGDGTGAWQSQATKYPGTNLPTEEDTYQAIAIADVDKDRYPDIIGAQSGGGVLIWFGDPDNFWVAQTSVFISGDYLGISVIDYSIDGLLDVVSVSPNSMKVSRQIRETEVGALQWLRGASGSASGAGYQGVASADFNRDGVPDVVAAKNDGGVHLWLGKRGGSWVKAITESSPPSPADVGQYYDVAAADFNNDGLMDVAASHNSGEGVKVWLGQFRGITGTATGGGPSSLVDTTKTWVANEWFGYQLTITSGIGKGQTRVVKSNTSNTLVTYSSWNIVPVSTDKYSLSRYLWSTETGPVDVENHYHITAADLNHDGKKDLVAGSDYGVKAWLNTISTPTSVTWSGNQGPADTGGYNGVAVGDVNEDGDPDIIAGNCESGDIDVWFGNGNGTWFDAYLESPPLGDNSARCYCDADGCSWRRDGIRGNGYVNGIQVNPAAITEEWTLTFNGVNWQVLSSGYGEHAAAWTDVPYTSDGGEVTFTIASGTKSFLYGDRFSFRTASGADGIGPRPERLGQILGMTRLYDGVATGDFDRDGNLDIAAGNAGGWGIQVWFGNGKGEWRTAYATLPSPECTNDGAWFITTNHSFENEGSDRMIAGIAGDLRYGDIWPDGAGPVPSLLPPYGPPFNIGVKTNGYLTSSYDWEIRTHSVPELVRIEDLDAADWNLGGGTFIVEATCDYAINELWTVTLLTPTTFSVEGFCTGSLSDGIVGQYYTADNNEFSLTISAATGTPFAPGDQYTFRTEDCNPTFDDNQPDRPETHIGRFGAPYITKFNLELAFTAFGEPVYFKPKEDAYFFTTYYPGILTNGTYYDVAVADLNRDGYDDIVAANKKDGGIQVWTNNGRGVWLKNPQDEAKEPWKVEESPINIGNYSGVTIVDFDQDGLLDIVGAHDVTGGIGIEVWRQVIDWELPYVTETSIAEGASDVSIESEIIITFSEKIDHTTLSQETVSVYGSESGLIPASLIYYTVYTIDDTKLENVLVISPERDFKVGEKITVTLRGVIKDLVGNSLDGDGDGVAEGSPIDDFILTFSTKDNIPQGLSANPNDADGCIALGWYHNAEGNLGGYNIYRSTDANEFPYGQKPTNEPFLTFIEAGINQHCDYTATPEIAYYYAITAVNDDILYPDESGFSETVVSVLLDKIPAAPGTPVAATVGRTSVNLTWTPVTTNEDGSPITDLTGYNLYRSEVSGASYNFVAFIPVPTAAYNDSGLAEGKIYYYRLTALDMFGNESKQSPELQVNLLYELAPAVPQNVILSQRDPVTVVVRWDPVTTNENGSPITDLRGYNIYRSDVTCTNFALANTGGPITGITEFVDENLTTGDTYCYAVTAVDNVGKASGESEPKTITLADVVPVPENLIAFPIDEDSVKLIWEKPAYEISLAGYNIYYATTPGGPTVKVNFAPITGTTLLVTGLTECQDYYFKVTAVEEGGVRESDLIDCKEVWARPHIPGDFDCDEDVDLDDYPALVAAFGSTYGQTRYSADVDLDQNLRIDGLDLADFARRL